MRQIFARAGTARTGMPADQMDRVVAERAARLSAEKAERAAMSAIRSAYAWPRCGQGFPATAAEHRAAAWAKKAHGSIDAAMTAMEVYS